MSPPQPGIDGSGGALFCVLQTLGWGMGQKSAAKARQALKLAEIREALMAAGCNTTAKQAAVLGVCRSTAWVLLNRDKRVGPSANVIKRILSSPNLPPVARRKVEEYVEERISGLYGHTEIRRFRDRLHTATWPAMKRAQNHAFRATA
jgi:hypothetical protein